MKNILKIINQQPKDHIYYSTVFGNCIAENKGGCFPIEITALDRNLRYNFQLNDLDKYGCLVKGGVCTLFPSEYNRDWDDLNTKVKYYTYQPVLVRNDDYNIWKPDLFQAYYENSPFPYAVIGGMYRQCIPLLGNELLKLTSNKLI